MWPSGARASSTFGGSWSPSALIGPPRVFPRYGDIGGAWAPGPRTSPVEWVELDFGVDAPMAAVHVYETHRAGSTFAVVDATGDERLLYAALPTSESDARVLEVAVDPPRPIRRLRIYTVNPGWAEVDTVGLLAAAPLPEALRTRVPPPSRAGRNVLLALVAVVALAVAGGVAVAVLSGAATRSRPAEPPRPAQSLAGSTINYARPDAATLAARRVAWANGVTSYSSEYSHERNAASGAAGAPDVYPRHGDIDGAWASHETDAGPEWITLRFDPPVRASSVVWAETFNPGAVARVDDVTDPAAPTVLWEGTSGVLPAMAVVGEVTLPAPRTIGALRLMLDTRRVAGWNEIDAVGLVPAP